MRRLVVRVAALRSVVVPPLAVACAPLLACLLLAGCDESRVSRPFGAACNENADCATHCLLPASGFPSGLCTETCHDDDDCTTPGTICGGTVEGLFCLVACASNDDCEYLGKEGERVWLCLPTPGIKEEPTIMACRGTDL